MLDVSRSILIECFDWDSDGRFAQFIATTFLDYDCNCVLFVMFISVIKAVNFVLCCI